MRTPSLLRDRRDAVDVKMTPMIDVVFLLLVFFIWTASFQVVEEVLPSNVSQAVGTTEAPDVSAEADFPEVVIRIRWRNGNPAWELNAAPIADLRTLRDRLNAIFEVNQDAPVVIHPDQETPLVHVIDVYDFARLAGFTTVQFAAKEAPAP